MNVKRYAGVAGEDVFTIFSFDADGESNNHGPRLLAGMSSNPVFIEIPEGVQVSPGYTYNGESFLPPKE
jgi:hypothetical protein